MHYARLVLHFFLFRNSSSLSLDVMGSALPIFLFFLYTLSLVKLVLAIISTITCRQMPHKPTYRVGSHETIKIPSP